MIVKLLNVKYSPNVGDGLLVECLEGLLSAAKGMTAVSSVDLAGRVSYGAPAHHRETMVRVLNALPAAVRPRVARAGLSAKLALGLRDHYRRELAGANAVVVSGGNLLSDLDLNFPMKIAAALREAARLEARIAVYGCGVASDWSRAGREMVCAALSASPPILVAVRDSASKAAWDRLFSAAAKSEASIVHDSGLLASTIYRLDAPFAVPARPVAAIGIMSTLAIQYHGYDTLSAGDLARWYLGLVDELIAGGFDVCLFTNGSPEDRRFADGVWTMLSGHKSLARIRLASVQTPVDLCRVAVVADVLVAFRLHALIAAYSYGKPLVALQWDPKVQAFLDSVALDTNIVDVTRSDPVSAARFLMRICEGGTDPRKLEQVLSDTKRHIGLLAAAIGAH